MSIAFSAPPTRYARAIRTWRGTPTLQYSITPRGRIRGRGQPVRRSFLRSLVGSSVGERSRKNEAPGEGEPY
jgi:hypothetical protein